ncbi:radical SAM protein [Candidatus Bathyarchaeota archaeon]|nr:radical SAM protein [Candidatus Bathyarchaeota archaeon]
MNTQQHVQKSSNEKTRQARLISWKHFGKNIFFYVPGFVHYKNKYYQSVRNTFPSISVTGSACSLNCSHCGGKLLETMMPATSPETLIKTCRKIKQKGAVGCLISGGCLPDGSVPINKFVDAIAEAKRLGLTVVVHTGLVNYDTAEKLKKAGVDAVSIDILGCEETAREIYHVNATLEDYRQSLHALKSSGIPFTPHILVGLHYGELRGEINALKMIAETQPSALIIIVFFPIKGTKMENLTPPSIMYVKEVLIKSRTMMPNIPIALGCARPKGEYRTKLDTTAVKAGVNGIAFPSIEAIKAAEKLGLNIKFSSVCCSQIYADTKKQSK